MITYHVSISWSSLDCLRDTLHKIIYENMSKFIGEIDIQQNRKNGCLCMSVVSHAKVIMVAYENSWGINTVWEYSYHHPIHDFTSMNCLN